MASLVIVGVVIVRLLFASNALFITDNCFVLVDLLHLLFERFYFEEIVVKVYFFDLRELCL